MNRARSIVSLVLICFFVGGCAQQAMPGGQQPVQIAQAEGIPGQMPVGNGAPPPTSIRKIIYTSEIDVVVDDMNVATNRLTKLVASLRDQGGYVSHQELSGSSGLRRRATWTIRVPVNGFDELVSSLEKLGELKNSSLHTQDITEAYVDLESRLKNKLSSEQRLLKHIEGSKELKDTLELERELSRVRGEIEQMQGQLNLMKNKSDLATVIVTFFERERYTPATTPAFGNLVARTFKDSLQLFLSCGRALILALVALTPWVVGIGPFVIAWVWIRRPRRTSPIANPVQ